MSTTTHPDLPVFTQSFLSPTPFFYFHHIINGEDATLTVQVIGPNLCFTFSHNRARAEGVGPARIRSLLEPKTVGFLALVKDAHRHILAWAESGHGSGARGDLLDAPAGTPVLANALWTRRVIVVARLLGIKMRSPFDAGRAAGFMSEAARRRAWGLFLGGHVEVKLAVHAVYAMLREFGVTTDFDNVTRKHLETLRRVCWADGTRPSFEIYFSRENCRRCGRLIHAIEAATGLRLFMCWKDRLVKKEYKKGAFRTDHVASSAGAGGAEVVEDEEDMEESLREIINIEDDDHFDDDVLPIDPPPIDLTDSGDESSSSMETIDLTDDSGSSPPLQPLPTTPGASDPADDYVNGLAYCVGQFDTSATPARTAILEFAKRQILKKRREYESDINKPLPATPVTDFEEPLQPISGADRLVRRSTHLNTTPTMTTTRISSSEKATKTPIKLDKTPARMTKRRKTTGGRITVRQERTHTSPSPSIRASRSSLVERNSHTVLDSEASSSDESIPPTTFSLHASPPFPPGPAHHERRQVSSSRVAKRLETTTPTKPPKRNASSSIKTSRDSSLNVPFGPPLSRDFDEPPSPF